jgi:transposase
MRKIREIIRLKFELGLSSRAIAASVGISDSTVRDYLARAKSAGIASWPLDETLDDAFLEQFLFVQEEELPKERCFPEWEDIHKQLQRKGVTLLLLWQEYKLLNSSGLQYSQFCQRYRDWSKTIEPVMRQHHIPGEKVFVDYAGMTVSIHGINGEDSFDAQIFVATLGASNFTYAEATRSQSTQDWISSHIRAFEYFGGCTKAIVCDNLKSGVTTPSLYDPDIAPTYYQMAKHYGAAVLPARVRKPKDKGKVENAVGVVSRWILAPLRDHKFFSLAELNLAIKKLLEQLNDKPFQKISGTRKEWFSKSEKSCLIPLPKERFELVDIRLARVHVDYHVELERHFFSVPYRLIQKEVEVRYNERIVEIFYKNKRVAVHARSHKIGGYTTLREHMPSSHQFYAGWTRERLVKWARQAGNQTATVCEQIIESKSYPEQGFKAVLGVISLGKKYGEDRLENACKRVLELGNPTYKSVKSTLQSGLDQVPLRLINQEPIVIQMHSNIRGSEYFQKQIEKG